MSEEIKTKVSRREFLKDAGLVVGGATIGSAAILSACKGETKTVTSTVTNTATSTVTKTVEVKGDTKYVCPFDSMEFNSVADLQAHLASAHADKKLDNIVSFTLNGTPYTLVVEPWWPVSMVLRDILGFYDVKVGCDFGNCGTCTVLVEKNGKQIPMFSCLMVAGELNGKVITTCDGLSNGITPSPVQKKFYDEDAFQCGYCTPGLILAATALLADNPKPTADEVRYAFSGHLCFCNNMTKTVSAMVGGVE